MARILYGLLDRPNGWSFAAIEDELRISERTLMRYLAACRRDLVGPDGDPLLEVFRRGDRRMLRLSERARTPDSTSYQALSFYFALTVFQFLDGTVLKDGVEDLWRRFYAAIPASRRARLADFDRKFYAIPYAPKDYRANDEIVDRIVLALVNQNRLRIEYAGVWRAGAEEVTLHEFDPYTLAMYRGGLYLIGRSQRHRRIVYLAIERMRRVERLGVRFDYPPDYSPARYTEGTFGIVEGPLTRVRLRLLHREGVALLTSRRIHPTQRFEERPDGTAILSMDVRGTLELRNSILSLGSHVEVVEPEGLRREVAAALREAARLYGPR
jgi:proteasome accessory factor B